MPDIFFHSSSSQKLPDMAGPHAVPSGVCLSAVSGISSDCAPSLRDSVPAAGSLRLYHHLCPVLPRPPPSQDAQELLGKERPLHSVQTTDAACSGQER